MQLCKQEMPVYELLVAMWNIYMDLYVLNTLFVHKNVSKRMNYLVLSLPD